MLGFVKPGQPVSFGGLVKATRLNDVVQLVKEAEAITGKKGRDFLLAGDTGNHHIHVNLCDEALEACVELLRQVPLYTVAL